MLHHRHQLHVGISHPEYVIGQIIGQLPVVQELGTGNRPSASVQRRLLPLPGTQMHLVDGHGTLLQVLSGPLHHPVIIRPGKLVKIPDQRRVVGAHLRRIRIGIRLQERRAVVVLDFIFIEGTCRNPRNKQLEYAGIPESAHLVAPSVPEVEIAHDADAHGIWCPDGKADAFGPSDT